MQRTWNAKPGEIERRWYIVDAEGKTLGRLATQIADTLREQLDRRPTEVIRLAVKGMLPRNRLARQQLTKLKVYAGPAEATATIVRRVLEELELEAETLWWNAVPTHPGTETSNRRPTRNEIEAGTRFVRRLAEGRRVLAIGRVAAAATGAPYIRHPSHGGAEEFRAGLLRFAAGGRRVRRFHAKDLDRKARRDRAPLVRR